MSYTHFLSPLSYPIPLFLQYHNPFFSFSFLSLMATNSIQPLIYRKHTPSPLGRRHALDSLPPILSLSFKPNNSTVKTLSLSSSTTFSSISTTQSTSFEVLGRLLSANDFREADNETRRLLIALAGEAAKKRGYVFFSEVQFIGESELKKIDELWRNNSNNKFGYSVQKRLWEKSDKDFTKFFIKVGWMKKLDTEVLQYNYRAFPDEFVWELNDETPEGHLPLTNALRGTQLLNCVLTHPAFAQQEGDEETIEDKEKQQLGKQLPVGKHDYSF